MRLITRNEKYAVYDDVLPKEDLKKMWRYIQIEKYINPHGQEWMKVWRLSDGSPVGGPSYKNTDRPFNNEMEIIARYFIELGNQQTDLLGDWNEIFFRPYIYPRNTKLSWHNDYDYCGAGIFYVHPYWSSSWGGELMVAECPDVSDVEAPQIHPALDHAWEDVVLETYGMGQYITCKPNRMVFTKGNAWHAVNRVDADAGDHNRCSIVAFFKKEERKES